MGWRIKLNMANKESKNAEIVAQAVIEKVVKGGKVVMKEIIKKSGRYAPSMATHSDKIIKTNSYQKTLKPFIEQLKQERLEALKEARKKRKGAAYNHCIESVDKLSKLIELLGGRPTERSESILTEEQLNELIKNRTNTGNAGG